MSRRAVPPLVLAGIVLTVYAASLAGGFVWDDRPLIVENRLIRDPGGVFTLLTSSFWQTGDRHDRFRSFFRPAVSLSYAADYAIWKLHPIGYRVTNLLLHFLCCWLVHRIALSEGLTRAPALAGAALFAVHPVHVESVAWISGRTDLVCAAFLLASFLARRRGWRIGSLALFLGALLAKEMAATLPLLVAADRWFEDRAPGRMRRALAAATPHLATLAVYLVLRHAVLGAGAEPLYRLSPESQLASAFFVVGRYTMLLLAPVGLDPHYPYQPVESLASPLALLGLTMIVIVGLAALCAGRTSGKTALWIVWTYVTLPPVLAFGRYGDVLMADRFLYIPSVGLALLVARGLALATASGAVMRRASVGAALVLLTAFGLAAHAQTAIWKDDLELFSRMVATSPDSGMVRCNLGLAYQSRGEYRSAQREFLAAIERAPSYALAYNNLAVSYEREGRLKEALAAYEAALRLAPAQLESRINAASLRVKIGDPVAGREELRALARHHPRYAPALYACAEALDTTGRRAEALTYLERALAADPFYANAHYMRGKILAERGETQEAARAMRRFLSLWSEEGLYADVARRVIDQAAKPRP